jgi:serine/threonine protein kinase
MKDPDVSPPRSDKELFFEAIEKASALERAAFLDAACGADAALRARLEVLLADHFRDGGFMKAAVAEVVSQPEPGAPRTEDSTLSFGRYKLLEKIGEGGFGDVWMAEQREPVRRRVALKILKPGMDSRQIVARFEAERQALAMMDHPHIAKIFDAGMTDTGRPYFVMELVRGIRITDYCDQHQLSTRGRLDLFIQVCQAIQHAHQKGIIHRDLKPSNILVTVNDGVAVPKVIDFGIAKATQVELTDKTVFTQFQQFIGTPAYISPEQAEMSSLDIDTRADIYSLGVVLYEILVGQTPFDVREMMQGGLDALRRIIREKDPQRPSTRLKTLPGDSRTTAAKRRQTDVGRLVHQLEGDLDWIVMKCLEKDRTRRYDTANGLAMDIQRHLTNELVFARPPSTAYRLHKMVRRNRKTFAAAAVVAMTLVVSATYSTMQAVRAQRAATAAEASEKLASTSLATAERERDIAKRANDKLQSSLTRFQFNRAVTFLDAGEYSQGAAFLARALRTDPSFWPAAARLISVLSDRGFSGFRPHAVASLGPFVSVCAGGSPQSGPDTPGGVGRESRRQSNRVVRTGYLDPGWRHLGTGRCAAPQSLQRLHGLFRANQSGRPAPGHRWVRKLHPHLEHPDGSDGSRI